MINKICPICNKPFHHHISSSQTKDHSSYYNCWQNHPNIHYHVALDHLDNLAQVVMSTRVVLDISWKDLPPKILVTKKYELFNYTYTLNGDIYHLFNTCNTFDHNIVINQFNKINNLKAFL